MRFNLTDDQKSIENMLLSFFQDRFGGAEGVEGIREETLDRELWFAIAELGLAGVMVSEAAGGIGLDLLTATVVAEAAGRYAVPAPILPNMIAAWLIADAGSTAQRERWLGGLLDGSVLATFALAEADGWLAESWTLDLPATGTKFYVERAAEADLLLVGLKGGRLAMVETNQPGLSIAPIDTLDRTRPLADVAFENVPLDLLDASPQTVDRLIDALLVTHAADALGAARGAQDRAVAYAHERIQFGRPIGAFQAVKHQLADISVEIAPARPLIWYAAHGWDTSRPDARRMAALAKAHVGDIAVAAGRAAIEVHGGIGFTWEHPAHLFLKRAMHDRTVLGLPAVHRERSAELAGWLLTN